MPVSGHGSITFTPGFLDREDLHQALRDHDFGKVLRLITQYGGISQAQLGALIDIAPNHIGEYIRGEHQLTKISTIRKILAALDFPEHLRLMVLVASQAGIPATVHERAGRAQTVSTGLVALSDDEANPRRIVAIETPSRRLALPGSLPDATDQEDPVRRRALLAGGTTLALAAGMVALEGVRHDLAAVLGQHRSDLDPDEWHEIVREYGYTYMATPPYDLLEPLFADILGLEQAATQTTNEADFERLARAGAYLAALVAMTFANLNKLTYARRWWRTARAIADKTNDPDTTTWIRGREVVRALYEQRPASMILRLAQDAAANTAGASVAARLELAGGTAQALALAGQTDSGINALSQVRRLFDSLPADQYDSHSVFCWAENRLRFTESYVYSQLGLVREASHAQDRAIAAYPVTYKRGPAQIELQRALCLVKSDDIIEGSVHAASVIERLPSNNQIRPVVDLAGRVLNAIPLGRQREPGPRDLRDCLMSLVSSNGAKGLPSHRDD
jgi:transcriptional regulator with XRE-family HTH domain